MGYNNSSDYIGGFSWAIATLSICLFISFFFLNYLSGESIWLVPLFALPLAIQTTGSLILFHRPREKTFSKAFYRFYVWTKLVCIASYHILGDIYLVWRMNKIQLSSTWLTILSAISLSAITVLVVLVVIMTLAIMCPPTSNIEPTNIVRRIVHWSTKRFVIALGNLQVGASHDHFLALSLFFSVFLGVSYLFGFAFAFHDKSQSPEHALYMKKLYIDSEDSKDKTPSVIPLPIYAFKFGDGQAIPNIESTSPALQGQPENIIIAERKKSNFETLERIATDVKNINDDGVIRITVVGHASETSTTGSSYLSNYELSEARASNVKSKILERLSLEGNNKWRNIEWLCLPSSNEVKPKTMVEVVNESKGPSTKTRRVRAPRVNEIKDDLTSNRFVEVRIERPVGDAIAIQLKHMRADGPKELELMDYIYFANYTITTTGYGDIVPNSSYAKFICSYANICEVFFLVVFFNALLSLKRASEAAPLTEQQIEQIKGALNSILEHIRNPSATQTSRVTDINKQNSRPSAGTQQGFDPSRD